MVASAAHRLGVAAAPAREEGDVEQQRRQRQDGQHAEDGPPPLRHRRQQQRPGHGQPGHHVDLHLRVVRLGIEVHHLARAERSQEHDRDGAQPRLVAARPQRDDAGDEDGDLQHDGERQRQRGLPRRHRVVMRAEGQEIAADPRQHGPGLAPGEAGPAAVDALAGPEQIVDARRAVVSVPDELRRDDDGQDRRDQQHDHRRASQDRHRRYREREQQRGQGREDQPPFDQPAQREEHADRHHPHARSAGRTTGRPAASIPAPACSPA